MMLSSDRLEHWNSGGLPSAFTISKLIRAAHKRADYAFLDAYFLEFLGLPTLH